jgi:F-type H+-transporting ATPase subunit c
MKKGFIYTVMATLLIIVSSPFVFAASETQTSTVDYTKAIIVGCSVLAAGLAIALGAGKVLLTMMVGLAMIESLAIYALVVSLILLYANPLLKYIGG